MELTDSTNEQLGDTRTAAVKEENRSFLGIDLNEIPTGATLGGGCTGGQDDDGEYEPVEVVRSIHDNPDPVPGAPAEVPEPDRDAACGACGRPESMELVVVCDACERGFHLCCVNDGVEAAPSADWMCSDCVTGGERSKLWPLGVKSKLILDMNASPPSDAEGYGGEETSDSRKHMLASSSCMGNSFDYAMMHSSFSSIMGLDSEEADLEVIRDEEAEERTLCLHAFSDLTFVSPLVFLYLLKECNKHGSLKATKKFQALQYRVHQVLANKPQPGPATFIVKCLIVLPMFGVCGEGFSHLVISALRRFFKAEPISEEDICSARKLAAEFFIATVGGSVVYDEKVMVDTLKVFDVGLTNIDEALSLSEHGFTCGSAFLEQYISDLIKSKSFMTAVSLLEHFAFRFPEETFLQQMVEDKDFQAAEKWANFMGKPSLCDLVQEYGSRNMLKQAYNVINKNDLQHEFPELYYKCKESAMKDLAEKACWDVAETKAKGDRQLLEYLVDLAMKAGYLEKVDELCNRYSLVGLPKAQEAEVGFVDKTFLRLNDLAGKDVVWVDEVNELRKATSFLERCRVVGLDCEWKPNYIKGHKPNKVSIMQIGSDSKIFILDLIKLYNDASEILDKCLSQILQSYSILKLGYNFQCDIKQLALSYGDLECFKRYDMLLDIQNVFKESCGGLAGLTKKILGVSLNKTRRNSDWEQRPLTQNQLEYAALDAAVLIRIFRHVRDHPPHDSSSETVQWKSHIVSHMDSPKKLKPEEVEALLSSLYSQDSSQRREDSSNLLKP